MTGNDVRRFDVQRKCVLTVDNANNKDRRLGLPAVADEADYN